MNKDVAVKLNNISKTYKLYTKPVDRLKESLHPFKKKYHNKFYALKNINLEIKKGEVLGIVGVNGAGKSTLLKIIAGILQPTKGRVNINGRVNAILELSSGLKGEKTGRENIILNLQINGIEKKKIKKLTDEIIDFADIGEHINQPVKTYSSGMKSRLGFGIATSTDPDILIVDEVLAVGDVVFKRKCYSKIESFFKDGKTVIFVSHSTQSVIEFCTRAILLFNREIIMDNTPKKVTDYYQKLVFSKDNQKVIDEINGKIETKKTEETKREVKKKVEVNNEFYLVNFKSKPIEYRNYDIDILDVMLIDKFDKSVNILQRNNTYTLKYKIKFNESFRLVKFGHLIKTVKGMILSGETLPGTKNYLDTVQKNSIYNIESKFIPTFINGTYFISVGVTSDINNEKIYLNMQHDILVFKMLESDECNFWGNFNIWKNQKVINEL